MKDRASTPMKFHTVIFEKNGETIRTCSLHAESAPDAHLSVLAFYDANPQFDIPGRSELTVRVEEVEEKLKDGHPWARLTQPCQP
jgi:hypothetical protein